MNYWGYRIDNEKSKFFFTEIKEGRLRQGWGYELTHNLAEKNVSAVARRNLSIFKKVKKGDILLIPHVEFWNEVVIAEATEDFDKGYRFDIPSSQGDYGHIFPVKYLKRFSRQNCNVDGIIRETLKCRCRFWNINHCEDAIKRLLEIDECKLVEKSSYDERFSRQVEDAFDDEEFANRIYGNLNKATQASEWEFILCEGLRRILPLSYSIQTTANKEEYKHGADILIKIPGILDSLYVIAIQVKDYTEVVDIKVVEQICKADTYFTKESGEILIDKYIVLTKAPKDINEELIKEAEAKGVKIIFDKELKQLLSQMAKTYLKDIVSEQ
jgi:hypothetical protein